MTDLKLKLPEGFLETEVRCDYTVSSDMKKVWAVLLDLLNEFSRVCEKHNIRWWGDGGTILGAERHKGFIPWDDDIDVMLMREDYKRLCEIAPTEFKHPYFFQTEQTDKFSIRGHAQLRNSNTTGIIKSEITRGFEFNQGIFLDVFPIDHLPDDEKLAQEQLKNIFHLRTKVKEYRNLTYHFKFKFRKNLVLMLLTWTKHFLAIGPMKKHFDHVTQYAKFEEEMQKYNNIETERVCKFFHGRVKPKHIWRKSWFDDTVYLPFEMFSLPVPAGYKDLLDTFFGDWHKFVKGTSAHGGCLFDVDRSYKEYLPILRKKYRQERWERVLQKLCFTKNKMGGV